MKRFKKIYIEITNSCNLNCSFCIGNRREKKFMSFSEFKIVLDNVKPYTNYLYFHILGEPLLHPLINEFIDYASEMGFYINITTNGYLIDKIKYNKNIRQINVSLHSFDDRYGVSLDRYLSNIFDVAKCLSNTYFSLRIWVDSVYSNGIFDFIKSYYNVSINCLNYDKYRICDNVFLSQSNQFIWPDLSNCYYNEKGRCYGLIDHIGILCNGTIVPCCLDSNGDISLGNIFSDSLDDIFKSKNVLKMIDGFKKGIKYCELCKHCNFLENKKES